MARRQLPIGDPKLDESFDPRLRSVLQSLARTTGRAAQGAFALFTRASGLLIVPAWLAAMSWLVAHDVWPTWTSLHPPPLRVLPGTNELDRRAQFTVFDEFGKMGTVWTTYQIDETAIRRDDLIWIERLPLELAPLRVTVNSGYTPEGVLDEFTTRLETQDADLKLHGERFPSDFSFTFESGPMERAFKMPLSSSGLFAGAFNPFAELGRLHVGAKWQMQVVNPLAMLTGVGNRFIPLLVEVTGEERIDTPLGAKNCLVVESASAKAWIDADGRVQAQEVVLPVVGRLRIVRVAGFDEDQRTRARRASMGTNRR